MSGWAAVGEFGGALINSWQAHEQRQHDEKLQKEFAQSGIQWKVEDAKKAGIHPLYALGAQTTQFSPSTVQGGDWQSAGQNIGRAIDASRDPYDKKMQQLQLRLLQSQIDGQDITNQQMAASLSRSLTQSPTVGVPAVAETHPVHRSKVEAHPLTWDHIKPKADEQVSVRSENPSVTAGRHGAWREYRVFSHPGRKPVSIMLPYSEEGPAEAMESVPLWMLPSVVKMNQKTYGGNWWLEFLKQGSEDPRKGDPGTPEWRPKPTLRSGSRHVYGPIN